MSKAWPGVVTEVIFIKYLWEEISLFLYKVVNFFKTLRRNITGDFLDGLVLLCYGALKICILTFGVGQIDNQCHGTLDWLAAYAKLSDDFLRGEKESA